MVDTITFAQALTGTTALTTGASPTAVSADPAIYVVTTGGTAGEEIVDIPLPALPLGGQTNPGNIGQRIIVAIETLTTGGDFVRVTVNGSGAIPEWGGIGAGASSPVAGYTNGIELTFEGAAVAFVWGADNWYVDRFMSDGLFLGAYSQTSVDFKALDANSGNPPGTATLKGGDGNGDNGGDGLLTGGASVTGTGGNAVIQAATGGGGAGHVLIHGLPGADPNVGDALWVDASGNLKLSAG